MRISDWSSDVCSSDRFARQLRRQRLGHERAAARGVAIDRDRNADPRSAQRDAAFGAAARDRFGQAVSVIGIIDAVRAVGAEVGDLVPLAAQPVGEQRLPFIGGMIGRSEEQTSELQSLMRISYAVFFLK